MRAGDELLEQSRVGHTTQESLHVGVVLCAGGAPDAQGEVQEPLPHAWKADALRGRAIAEVVRSLLEEHLPEKERRGHLYGVYFGYEGNLWNAAHLVRSLMEVPDAMCGAERLSAL